jgi:hypothetical protein
MSDLTSIGSRSRMNTIPKRWLLAILALSFAFVTGCASTAKQEYFDDSVVTTTVKTAILNDPGLKVLQINVETFKGVVQLPGSSTSRP